MITLDDHIQELPAELRGCYFTRRERAAVEAELGNAIAEQAELDRAFERRPGGAVQSHRGNRGRRVRQPPPPSAALGDLRDETVLVL